MNDEHVRMSLFSCRTCVRRIYSSAYIFSRLNAYSKCVHVNLFFLLNSKCVLIDLKIYIERDRCIKNTGLEIGH